MGTGDALLNDFDGQVRQLSSILKLPSETVAKYLAPSTLAEIDQVRRDASFAHAAKIYPDDSFCHASAWLWLDMLKRSGLKAMADYWLLKNQGQCIVLPRFLRAETH